MSILKNQTHVLLPGKLLDKRSELNEQEFKKQVEVYLRRYPNYTLVKVNGSLALCDRQ